MVAPLAEVVAKANADLDGIIAFVRGLVAERDGLAEHLAARDRRIE